MQKRTQTSEELQSAAADLVSSLQERDDATIVALSGVLGAGKTTFAQGLARALGVQEVVSSPTFVIEKVYALSGQKWDRLIHIDAYRLNSSHELEVLGWRALTADPKNLIVLEWPERVADLIPEHALKLRFDIEGDARIIREYGEESGV